MKSYLRGSAIAADVSLNASDPVGTSSFTTAGQWSNAAAPGPGNRYFTGAFTLRTPNTAGSFTFGGDSLSIDAGTAGRLLGKGAGSNTTQTVTVANLILNGGRLEQAGGENTTNVLFTLNGNIHVTAASVLGAIGANTNGATNFEIMDIGATISGTEPLSVAGAANGGVNRGVVRLSAANTYSGQIDVFQPTNGGTISSATHRLLQLNHLDALRFATLGLATTAENPVSFAAAANTGTFRIAGLAGSAGQTLSDTAGNPVTLEIGGTGLDSFYAGALRGTGHLVKAGEGTVIMQGPNQTYTGSTTVLGGVLSLGTGTLLHNDSTLSIASGATLDLFHEETDVVAALTLGGVVQPGNQVLEMIPLDDQLLIEARVSPKDIAFLRPGQPAIVKFTAYDFVVYGGLNGTLEHISADTITDERDNTFYLVRVRTERAGFDPALPIMPGMTTQVDILTGKKTVLAYLLKPVLRAKQNALTER